jgi:hypothetical protein
LKRSLLMFRILFAGGVDGANEIHLDLKISN